ncbi:MAG: L-lactate permease [Chloroflexi bacterium]|nr:L-lactate permease [Chloroflexota bacterium]
MPTQSLLPPLTLFTLFLAALPVLAVLYLMVGRHWGGSKAGVAGWATAVLVSVLFFGAGGKLLLVAWGKAILLALFVLYVIWMALLLYHTVNEAGVIDAIGQEMPALAQDKPAQALLVAWIFGSFLQGATGFGVPAAVVAPLLVGMGFAPNTAVTMGLLGHAWAVTFGSLGSSFLSLMAATGEPGEILASPAAILLAVSGLGCGLGVLWLAGGRTAVRQRGLFLLVMAVVMGAAQWAIAMAGLWTVAAFGAGLVGLIVSIFYFTRVANRQAGDQVNLRRLVYAFRPYLLLIVIIVLGRIVFKEALNVVNINYDFPQVAAGFGWQTAAEPGRSVSLFGHAGALLLYTSLLIFIWFRREAANPQSAFQIPHSYSGRIIWQKTRKGWVKPTIGVYSLVAMALTMQHAGMTQLLAEALSAHTGPIFPLISPFIGALGAFMTGSNTNSNVVFGQLQQGTAVALNLSVPLILAAQTAGGAIGSLFAPAKVIVGSSTVEGADDGEVLKLAALYGLAIVLVIGLLTLIFW